MLFRSDRRSLRLVSYVLGLFALLALISIGLLPAQAAPVSPKVQVLVQPNGTKFEARQWGDEWVSGWETTSGLTILRDSASGNWVYASRGVSGALEASGRVVGRDKPPEGIALHLRPRSILAYARASGATLPFPRRGDTPSIGTNNLLTILVNYSDTKPTYSPEDFNSLLFGNGNKSMADYYAQASYGKLKIQAGPAGVRGWYTINMTAAEAEADYRKMAFLAIQAADRAGVDFAAYDMDGDCDVDTINIIHQGSGGPAHAGNILGYGPYVTQSRCVKGGYVTAANYITLPERDGDLITTIGVFAHEYGHVLGLPDLYDNDFTSSGSGAWNLMGWGTHNCIMQDQGSRECLSRMGDTPALMDPWSRMVLNWSTPVVIKEGAAPVKVTLPPASESPTMVLFGSSNPSGEYFIAENRQKSGFDQGLPGSGLLVWHVDDEKDRNLDECAPRLPGECATRHYKVAVVQADGRWDLEEYGNIGDDGDPFPGAKGVTSLNDDTNPSVRLYSGARSGISITAITQSGKNISALMAQESYFDLRYSKDGTGRGDIALSPSGTPPECAATSCTVQYKEVVQVTLTATPAPGSDFKGWSGADCSGMGSCTVTMSSDQQVTATFEERNPFKLFSGAHGSGEGRVTMSPAGASSTCDESKICETLFGDGTIVTLTAEPAAGSVFAGWTQYSFTGDETELGPVCSETNICTVTMSTDRYVNARFEKLENQESLSILSGGSGVGTITRSPLGSDGGCSTGPSACQVQYERGTVVTLTARSQAGSFFAGWSGAGCSGTGSCTVTMSSSQQVTATFEAEELFTLFSTEYGSGEGRVIISPPGVNSTCSDSQFCETRFQKGTTVTLTAEPAAGSVFARWLQMNWTGDKWEEGPVCSETNTCTVTMSTVMHVFATFEKAKPKLFSLTLQKDGTGGGAIARSPLGSDEGCSTGSSACQVQYEEGATVTLTATASAGSVFAGWSGTGGCSGTGACTLTMSAARSVTATFNALRTFALTYRKTGTGSGTVTFSPPGSLANCTANCTNSFASGTVVTVTAAAEAGSAFAGWSGIRGCSGTRPCNVTMTRAMSLKASFRKLPIYALSYTKAGKGAGTVAFSPAGQVANCAGKCTNRYVSGTVVTLTATPQPGSAFLGWSGNRNCSGTAPCTLTLSRAQSVRATFSPVRASACTGAGCAAANGLEVRPN